MKGLIILLVTLSLALPALLVNPGIKMSLTQKGLTYAKDVGIVVLKEKVSTITVADISGSTHAPVIGTIDYTLSDVVIKDLTFPTTAAKIVPNSAIEVEVSGAGASITLNWSYREHSWPHIKGHGSADITVSGTSISVVTKVSETGGKAIVSSFTSSVSIGDLKITVHGGPSWLYDLFINLFKSKIKDAAEKAIESAIDKQKPLLDGVFAKIPNSVEIANEAELDFALTAAPIIGASSLTLPLSAQWIALIPKKASAPVVASAVPTLGTTKMLEIAAAPSVIDGASWTFWYEGKMAYTITPSQVPPSSPIKLNTTNFRGYVPLLYQKYPNKGIDVKITADAAPVATVNASGIEVKGTLDLEVLVEVDSKSVPAFTLSVAIVATATAKLSDTNVYLNMTYFSSSTTLKKSYIGTFDPTTLETVIKFLMNGVLFPYANSYANKGFTLPVIKGATLVAPVIGYGPGYIYVSSDVHYTP